MKTESTACMGGWCEKRDECPAYVVESNSKPAERLCVAGSDGEREGVPVVIQRAAGSWEGPRVDGMARARPFDGLLAA